jgi:hypothetical protein
MALIENLERDDWEEFLRSSFRYALDVLKKDRYKPVGSSVDDLKSWLTAGGIDRVRRHLQKQMEMRGFSETHKTAVISCLESLATENRCALLDLATLGIVPGSSHECLAACGFSETEIHDLLQRMVRGERPFDEWMRTHGRSDKEIAEVYSIIDRWLIHRGIIAPPPPSPNLN